ncbi:enoyl-CoA hydratase-related protein, partial [Enterococcus faecium]|uniref:enoyl-CoA hydratase-related protein n=1 Tax=Enterococcus faecium TaxID=1352 RepID=UPI003F429929
MSNMDKVVGIEKRGAVATVTLLRSARRNAMDQALIDGVKDALLNLDRDKDVGAIVLVGAAPGFSA